MVNKKPQPQISQMRREGILENVPITSKLAKGKLNNCSLIISNN